jgi:hypothetical protein
MFERITKYLEKNKRKRPWPYGRKRNASEQAVSAWNTLTKAERLLISKHSPSRRNRNEIIGRLIRDGIQQNTICELTGLSRSTVCRFAHRNNKLH